VSLVEITQHDLSTGVWLHHPQELLERTAPFGVITLPNMSSPRRPDHRSLDMNASPPVDLGDRVGVRAHGSQEGHFSKNSTAP